jgi:LDH2 family malate/lactate/ureidoglycolate dehydrogenase
MSPAEKEKMFEGPLMQLATNAIASHGVPQPIAEDCAEILVMAEMMGLTTHGVGRILSYGERLAIGGIDPLASFKVEAPAPAMRRVDGANGLGPAIGYFALREGMKAARETGIAIVFCSGSNHFGPIAPYSLIAALEGFATLISSNASVTIAPTGGRETRLGNNPMGFGFPNPGGDPIILDMAMSVAARGKIRDARKAGVPIPEGWATDKDGHPTTDPNAALDGFLLPFGGHKGYGLSLCVDMMSGLLSGAAYLTHVSSWVDAPEKPQNVGHSFVLIDTARLMPPDILTQKMDDFGDILHSTPPVDAEAPVMVPGERELKRMAHARDNGFFVDADTMARLREMVS